eukprot:1817299-Pleurochrysis_carterae.AAC.1
MPSAMTGSPTATFTGAARRPSSASPSTASCACTCARVCGGAGAPPLGLRVPRIDSDVGHARQRLYDVVEGHVRKVVDVHLQVSWLGVPRIGR